MMFETHFIFSSYNFFRSLEKACACPLLKDYEIHVTTNVKPEPKNMKGGHLLSFYSLYYSELEYTKSAQVVVENKTLHIWTFFCFGQKIMKKFILFLFETI